MTELSLDGRNAIITGANQGLGLEIARAYVRAGANVLICARDQTRLAQAQDELKSLAASRQITRAQVCDVSQRQDIEQLIENALQLFPQLHILVNNAGVYGPMGAVEEIDWDEWVNAIAINLFGSVLMCRAVLPHFKLQHYGKIIQLSGGGATTPLPRISAYAASKAAIVRFVDSLAEEVRTDHIDVNAIAPGALNTQMLDQVLDAGPERVGEPFFERARTQKIQGGAPLEKGAMLAVFLGSGRSDGITGKLLSAPWDPWESLPEHLDDLDKTDVYTLRRIVPKDRALSWGEP